MQIKLKIKHLSLINRLLSQHHINAHNVQSIYRSNNPNIKQGTEQYPCSITQ